MKTNNKNYIVAFVLSLLLVTTLLSAQNSARLFTANGETFKVLIGNVVVNHLPEANVLIENSQKDTLVVTLEFENKLRSEATLYLLDKGEKTVKKEYNYKIVVDKEAVKVSFVGIKEAVVLPKPLVPNKSGSGN